MSDSEHPPLKAVLWDFGGVILESPFEAFSRYEARNGLPDGFLRGLNANNPHTNAWAQLERSEVSFEEFCVRYEDEALTAGYTIVAADVMASMVGGIRPNMLEALRRVAGSHLKTAMLTNNFAAPDHHGETAGFKPGAHDGVLRLFDFVIESSKAGVRKPDPRFYEIACEALEIHPTEAVFLDDLGINLKPAKAMGMRTIKVVDPDVAIADLEAVVGFALR